LGVDIIEGVTLKDTIIEIMKEELSTEDIKEKLGIEKLFEEVEHLDGVVNNKIEVAVSNVKDDLTEKFKNQIKNESAGTEKMGDISKSISSLKNDVTGLQTNVSKNRTSFTNLQRNLGEEKNELENKFIKLDTSFSNLKRNLEGKADVTVGHCRGLKSEVNNLITDLSKLRKDVSSIGSDVLNLKGKIKSSKAEKIMTAKDEPPCENCRKNPCLNEEPVTLENFVKGARVYWTKGNGFGTLTKKEDNHLYFEFRSTELNCNIERKLSPLQYSC